MNVRRQAAERRRVRAWGERVHLLRPGAADETAFLAAVARSAALHHPWCAPPATSEAFRAYLRRLRSPRMEGLLVRRNADLALVGVINASEIVRGHFRSAFLGYYAFLPLAGRGLMAEGLEVALSWFFGPLGLHRVEANIQPGNAASIALVKRLGFRLEGFSPRYLEVDGDWRDHERWALLAEGFASRTKKRCNP